MSTPDVDMSGYDRLGCLQDLFIAQARKTPNKVAVVNCDGSMTTFQELDHMTDILASELQKQGLGKNKVGGILMERCVEYVVSCISILKAGGAYLPIEVAWPQPLLESVLQDASPVVICTKDSFSSRLKNSTVPSISLSGSWLKKINNNKEQFTTVNTSLDDLAYVVYSSGTTGKPKGIECPHRGSVFSYTWRHRAYPYTDDDREACNVFFVWEMLRPLAKGIPMYVIPDDVIYDPPKLANFICKNRITRTLFTPSLLQALLEYKGINVQSSLETLRVIVLCGEVMTSKLRDKVAELTPWIKQLNLYSISECHDVSSADLSDIQAGSEPREFCPVGKLFPGVTVVVMDDQLNVKAVGEPGEMYIGGPCLAIGYLNRPDLNAERFIVRDGVRLYRTGDWGYCLSDGSLEVCGRCDSMVKSRGYTIELEAVKVNIVELPGVLSATVQAYGPEGGNKTLVAFLVPKDNEVLSVRQLRSQLKKSLPFYMIPSRFIVLNRIPLVEVSGKLDTKALSALYQQVKEGERGEVLELGAGTGRAVTKLEISIAHLWSSLLDTYVFDVDESFFDIGGHSLLAAALTGQLNEQFGLRLSTGDIFKHPTVSTQAALVSSAKTPATTSIDLQHELSKYQIELNGVDANIRAFWQSLKLNPNKLSNGRVLLTGATGYVGCFLLNHLVLHTQATVICVVRDSPGQSPFERLEHAREQFGLRKFLPRSRVLPIRGDVTLTNLGLPKDVYKALCVDVDLVIHAAAHVNLILPFSALYTSNVVGTHNMLEFCFSGKIKPLHHISTSDVFPLGAQWSESADLSTERGKQPSGYGQAKWLAEQLVRQAATKGLPTAIYRCGNVGGSRLTAGWNPSDFILHVWKGVIKTGLAPDISWKIEMTPVDFVSDVIVQLACSQPDSIGKTFHLINKSRFPCKDLWKLFADLGYKIKLTSLAEWKKTVFEKSKEDPQLGKLSSLLAVDDVLFEDTLIHGQENISKMLLKIGLPYPELTPQVFTSYVKDLVGIGIFPKPQSINNAMQPVASLAGKVVLVTGASSGIGEGIARKLAHAGAHVVLAARRLERLQALAEELKAVGATAYPVQMDVCDANKVASCVQEIEAGIGPIDILVNNAGVMHYQYVSKCDLACWRQMVDVNIGGVLNVLAAVLGGMAARRSGHIINISSDGARKPFGGLAVYCGTKYFVRCLSGAVRSELVQANVKVTDIQPGDVTSELHNHASDAEAELAFDCSTKVPILRPEDVGDAVLFALSQPSYCAINEILLEPQQLPLY